jgi:hypothetical protein
MGPVLAKAGFVVLCLDMPGHGARQAEGSESALAKAALWRGETLMGRMLGDLRRGWTRWRRIRASMRADRSDGPVDGRDPCLLAGRARRPGRGGGHLCAFADMAPLIASGGHDLHGIYMSVPGLLRTATWATWRP